MRLIDADALMEYCNNLKDKTIDANDIARFPTAVGWISVKERLPEPEENVLIFTKTGLPLKHGTKDDLNRSICYDNRRYYTKYV